MKCAAIILLVPVVCIADLIPASRLANWSVDTTIGVTGGIPNRTSIIDVTQAPYSCDNTGATDVATCIQSALNAATSGQVVYCPGATAVYRINTALTLKSNVSLRGDVTTKLDARGLYGLQVPLDPSWGNAFNSLSNISSGLTAGSNAVVVASPGGGNTPFAVGRVARITWPNDPNKPVIHLYGFSGVRTFDCLVTGVSGSTITFSPPLPATFVNPGTATIEETQITPVTGAGVENLIIDGTIGGGMNMGVNAQLMVNSWIKNVKVVGQTNYGFALFDDVLDTVTHSWVTPGGGGTNHSGFLTNSCSGLYIYDNIVEDNQPDVEINFSTAGSVYAYNLFLTSTLGVDTNHAPHNSFNLFEGNIASNFISDGFFGSDSEETIFRNWITAVKVSDDSINFGAAFKRFSRNMSLVGNIVQKTGHAWTDESVDTTGNPNIGNGTSFGTIQFSLGSWSRDLTANTVNSPYTGTLTTRTDNNHGVITLSAGTAANFTGSNRGDIGSELIVLVTSPITRTFVTNVSGNLITVDSTNGGSSQLESLPALNTVMNIWASPGGFQERDLDVAATTIRRVNYYYFDGQIPAGEALNGDTFLNSYYLASKPAWFHSLSWPPFDPQHVGTPAYTQIPAGYRYVNGVDPPDTPPPPGGGFMPIM